MVIGPQLFQLIAEEKFANFDSIDWYISIYSLATSELVSKMFKKIDKYTCFNNTIFQSSMTFDRCCGYNAAFLLIFLIQCVIAVQMMYQLYWIFLYMYMSMHGHKYMCACV
ncbi:hypothetical protein L798_01748 [Zootermopsis nevadensis]|uniref:Uncharacterized protein n=1 Tax=Zootermopsis nevadensis TaxID=136037 RepID=A0A067QVE9_ZOONE|nr:hypothetical protein L798_01748 [Zootermopsis nevadensis]